MDADPAIQVPAAPAGLAALVPRLADDLIARRPGRVYRELMAIVERPLIAHVLAATRGNQLRAARLLGLNRNTLRRRCRELSLGGGPRPPSPSEGASTAPSEASPRQKGSRRRSRRSNIEYRAALTGAASGTPTPSEAPSGDADPLGGRTT